MTGRFRPVVLALAGFSAALGAAEIPLAERRSGYEFMGRETRAMQDDEATNPGMLWVLEGEALWQRREGALGRSCADCHADFKGVAARYPALDAKLARPVNLEQRINACRTERLGAPALAYESRELLSLTAYVARQSRGMPIEIASSNFVEEGKKRFQRRQGQLNLACTQCHDDNWGKKLAGNAIPQAHPTGYPIYRLEWQGLGSLQRRLRNCLIGMRAEPYAYGSPEFVELELYLMWRARGMPMESPAVRP